MSEPTIDEQLAARRKLRDDATARQLANPCPDACGHAHITPGQSAAWGLWSVLRRTGRMGKENVDAALEALAAVENPLPAPEVLARPAAAGEVPKTAQALYDDAIAAGWYGSITYSRGPIVHATTGKFLRMVDSICVRLARQVDHARMQRVVAGWTDGAFAKATAWDAGEPARILDAEPVKAHVRQPRGLRP